MLGIFCVHFEVLRKFSSGVWDFYRKRQKCFFSGAIIIWNKFTYPFHVTFFPLTYFAARTKTGSRQLWLLFMRFKRAMTAIAPAVHLLCFYSAPYWKHFLFALQSQYSIAKHTHIDIFCRWLTASTQKKFKEVFYSFPARTSTNIAYIARNIQTEKILNASLACDL